MNNNCVTTRHNNYNVARSRIQKDPKVEISTNKPFDTDSYMQKDGMRDKRGSVIVDRDIYQNPSRDIREYPINIFIDSYRQQNIDNMSNGFLYFDITSDSNSGISTNEDINNVIRMKIGNIRIPNNGDSIVNANIYNSFTLLVEPLGSYRNIPLPNGGNANSHFDYTPTFNGLPNDPNSTITLSPMFDSIEVAPQGQVSYLRLTFRSPFNNYNFPKDKLNILLQFPGSNPAIVTSINHGLNKLYTLVNTNYVTTSSSIVTNAINNPSGYTINTIIDNDTFSINIDTTTLLNPIQYEVIIPVNRILFGIEFKKLSY